MTPEILIVGDPAGRRKLADLIAVSGYGVAVCAPHELNRRIRIGPVPEAIVACMDDLDADVVLAGLRRTRAGASIPVVLYGQLGGQLRDLADVLDIGADSFLEEPAREHELRDALAQFVQPSEAPPKRGREWDDERSESGRSRPEERAARERGARDRPSRDEGLRDIRDTEYASRIRGHRDETRPPSPRRDAPRRDDPRRDAPRRDDPRQDEHWDDGPEKPALEPERPRGAALSELHRTLERFDASLRTDERSDPELSELGLHHVPDVDGDALDEDPLVTEIGEHLRGRPRGTTPVRGDEPTQLSDREIRSERQAPRSRPRSREPEVDRSRPRSRRHEDTQRLDSRPRSAPQSEPRSESEAPSRGRARARSRPRSREAQPPEATETGREAQRTRAWERPVSEGPLRRGRDRAQEPPRSSPRPKPEARSERSSAVLLGRRPGRERDSSDATNRFDSPSEPPRSDPRERDTPWPADDFDPSESTMIRRERSSATTRRRSAGGWRQDKDKDESREPREFPWGRGGEPPPRSTLRGRPPERKPEPREPTPKLRLPAREPEPSAQVTRARDERPSSAPASAPASKPASPTRRTRRSARATPREQSRLRIDPSLSESGKLSDEVDVATVLWALHEQRFTGKLRLNRARVEKQVWLHDGEAVFARSTATSDRLVDGLLRRGVLTRPQYETARRLAAKEPRRAGQLLVDAGFLKARELDLVLRDHLARVIDATFVWTEGNWATEPGERTDEPIQLEVPIAALILDGVRYRCDASDLEDRLTQRVGGRGPLVPRLRAGAQGELGESPQAAVDALVDTIAESFRLLPEEESWLRRLDGRHGVAALLADGADEQALFALLFTLDLGGHVDLREQPKPIAESDRDPAQVDSDRILARLRLAREADYFELLGLARDASRNEVRQAHTSLSTTFSEDALEDDSRQRHARELRELRAALEEARDILSDDAMRSAYLAHLGDSA